jgi:phage I-like protein
VQPPTASTPQVKPKPAKPDEGEDVDKATVDALRAKIKALPQEHQTSIAQWAKEAKEAGQTISLSAKPSARRFEIARLLIALASTSDALATLARHMPVENTVGGTVCRLTNTQAADLVRLIEKGK